MAVIFIKRPKTEFVVTGTHTPHTLTSSTKKFIIYDGIFNEYHYAYTSRYKLYYDTEGDVGMRGLIIRDAFKTAQDNSKLKLE